MAELLFLFFTWFKSQFFIINVRMKTFILNKLIILFILLLFFQKLVYPQTSNSSNILFEGYTSKGRVQIYSFNNVVNFTIDNSIISKIPVNGNNFSILKGIDGESFGITNYYFGQKSEKSFLEIYLLDNDFKVTLYKKFSFSYEEPFPRILQISSQEFVLLFPSTGLLKIYTSNSEKEIELIKENENRFFQERLGHLAFINNHLIVFLSQIRNVDNYISKIFSIDLKSFEVSQFDVELDLIYRIYRVGSDFYFTGIDTEPVFQGGFYSVQFNPANFNESKILKLSDVIIEGEIKNSENLLFSRDCFYRILKDKLEKLNLCFEGEIIIDAIIVKNNFYVLTRKDLQSYFYKVNSNLQILNRETLNQYLSNPEIDIQSNKLIVKDKNKIVLAKNLSEE